MIFEKLTANTSTANTMVQVTESVLIYGHFIVASCAYVRCKSNSLKKKTAKKKKIESFFLLAKAIIVVAKSISFFPFLFAR